MIHSIKMTDFFSNLAEAFYGSYSSRDHEIEDLKEEILEISHIPPPHQDKVNLKSDLDTVISHYNSASKRAAKKVVNGKAKKKS